MSPLEADLIELMLDEVTLEPWMGSDGFADPVYGLGRTVQCRIQFSTRRIIAADGREVVSSVQITTATPNVRLTTKDRLTLPDGASPAILRVAEAKDDTGPYYQEIFA